MLRTFDPITKTVSETEAPNTPLTLQQWCRKTILKAVTLRRLERATRSLPLPAVLARKVSMVNLADFIINVEQLGPGNHQQQEYPATCCFDNKCVILKVLPKGSDTNLHMNPSFVMAFEENDVLFCIYDKNDTLNDRIAKCKDEGTPFQECFIWKTITELVEYILQQNMLPGSQISSSLIHFHSNDQLFIKKSDDQGGGQHTMVQLSADSAIYEAPEVLSRNNPDKTAFSWVIGCIIYEMLALEPAFYDRTGNNPFEVFMNITQGKLPPEPQSGSKELKDLMVKCFTLDKNERINVEEILKIAKSQTCQSI